MMVQQQAHTICLVPHALKTSTPKFLLALQVCIHMVCGGAWWVWVGGYMALYVCIHTNIFIGSQVNSDVWLPLFVRQSMKQIANKISLCVYELYLSLLFFYSLVVFQNKMFNNDLHQGKHQFLIIKRFAIQEKIKVQ